MIGRERVLSSWYGATRPIEEKTGEKIHLEIEKQSLLRLEFSKITRPRPRRVLKKKLNFKTKLKKNKKKIFQSRLRRPDLSRPEREVGPERDLEIL